MMFASPSLLAAVNAFRNGTLDRKAYLRSCFERGEDVEPWLKAFTHRVAFDDLDIASEGPLAGIPVGVKDIIATANIPTTNGSPIYAGHRPEKDAAIVARIKALGGTVFGKTVTTEFAWRHPGPTVNPWNRAHTPGGSSSGSAAAVAAGIVPLALGTQTVGSVVRPAAYCGVIGFKPSFGLVPREGVHPLAPALDHVGFFTCSVDDVAYAFSLLAEPPAGNSQQPLAIDLVEGVAPLSAPRLAVVRPAFWDRVTSEQDKAFNDAVAALKAAGARVEELEFPTSFWAGAEAAEIILAAEAAAVYNPLIERFPDKTSDKLKELAAAGDAIPAPHYIAALQLQTELRSVLRSELSGFDALVTVPASGEAPEGLGYTGDAIFCALWTYLGVPALTLPIARSSKGLPLGLQIVSDHLQDERALRVAKWVEQSLRAPRSH